MAALRACNGVVLFGVTPTIVGEVTAYSANAVADEVDTSSMGSCTASSIAGTKKTTGTVSMNWDPDDVAQGQMLIGTITTLTIQPEGTGSGLSQLTSASALVLQMNITAEVNGVVTLEMNYSINGEFDDTDQA